MRRTRTELLATLQAEGLLFDGAMGTLLDARRGRLPAFDCPERLVLEAPVTPESCGKDLQGAVLRPVGSRTEQVPLSLAMPDCGDGDGAVMMPLPGFPLAVAAN